MHLLDSPSPAAWDAFLSQQRFRPFLQSFTMGEVYAEIGQAPVRLVVEKDGELIATCFGHIVPARRGKHLSIPYGPIIDETLSEEEKNELLSLLFRRLGECALENDCSFLRMAPFLPEEEEGHMRRNLRQTKIKIVASPLHLLAEHVWYLPLTKPDPWTSSTFASSTSQLIPQDSLLAAMRKTTRNLIGRAQRDGVIVEASKNPNEDLKHFLRLHEETRRRHGFTPYTDDFFRAQVRLFAERKECTVYLAKFQDEVIASSIHIHAFGETSYHHGASSSAHSKIPASYLLQWTAIQDALRRGDQIYNFWGIAPMSHSPDAPEARTPLSPAGGKGPGDRGRHPFAGVSLFKTGFGGSLLNLMHCIDVPVKASYWVTYGFEMLRKYRRGF